MTNAIILRRDFKRQRRRVQYRIRMGRIRAEVDEDRRITKVAQTLVNDGVRLWEWHGGIESYITTKIIGAVLEEWGPLRENDLISRFRKIVTAGTLIKMTQTGELIAKRDRYGRTRYYKEKLNGDHKRTTVQNRSSI